MTPKDEFPIHFFVWNNDRANLERFMASLPLDKQLRQESLEKLDPRGRTPLLLAVSMGHRECAEILLKNGADPTVESKQYWSVVDESVTSGDPELAVLCLRYRDFQRFQRRRRAVADLLDKLRQTADFYVEMKWEFHSWVPFVSKVCPSDTYRIYKKGPDVRIDTTLLGFDNGEWKRGRQTFIFKAKNPHGAQFIVIDHEAQVVFIEDIPDYNEIVDDNVDSFTPTQDAIATRLTSPVAVTYVDVEKITFERKQSGLPGFKTDKNENINGFPCKVFTASNVELVTKVRTEHLLPEDKQALENQNRNMFDSVMSWFQGSEIKNSGSIGGGDVKPEEYFNSFVSLDNKDVGRRKEISAKCRKFNATLWLADEYPLSLEEQVLPIVDLMASTNAHFARLRNFITLQLPSGFPVKIEIPLFHLITASVTFENTYSEHSPVTGVTPLVDAMPKCCVVDDSLFDIPPTYSTREMTSQQHNWTENEEDALLQYAIQQSLSHNPDQVMPPVRSGPMYFSDEDIALQRAIDESLRGYASGDIPAPALEPVEILEPNESSVVIDDLDLALAASLFEEEERRKAIKREEEELAEILKLSLNEK